MTPLLSLELAKGLPFLPSLLLWLVKLQQSI
jgi:hypothetical protein